MFASLPPINLQALYGVLCLILTWILVKVIKGILNGRLPGGVITSTYLRVLLGFCVAAGVILLGGALFNILLI